MPVRPDRGEGGLVSTSCVAVGGRGTAVATIEEYKQADREITLRSWKRGFLVHAAIYSVVVPALVVLNVLLSVYTDAGFFWFRFRLLAGGSG